MTIKAVIFDLDGTLVKFNLDYKMLRAETKQILIKEGLPASIFSLDESIFEMIKKAQVFMKNNGKEEKEMSKIKGAVLKLAERYEVEAARNTELLPGVSETLKVLKKMNLKLGLFTINCDTATNYTLQQLGLRQFFDAVVTRNCVEMVKPAPDHLLSALETLDVSPEEAIVVGDSVSDVKSAQEVKAVSIGVPADVSTPEELARAGATCLITSLTDLPTLIDELGKKITAE